MNPPTTARTLATRLAWVGLFSLLCLTRARLAAAEPRDAPASSDEVGIAAAPESPRRTGWLVLPGAFYTTEKGANLAGAVLYYFRPDPAAQRPSLFKLTTNASSRGGGSVGADLDLWLDSERLHVVNTNKVGVLETAYYGVGSDTTQADREDYTRLRVESRLEVTRKLATSLFVGGSYDFRWLDITDAEVGGAVAALDADESGRAAGLGATVAYDTRDNVCSTFSGALITLTSRVYSKYVGGRQDFIYTFMEASYFVNVYRDHVLAFDGRVDLRAGDVPALDFLAEAGGKRLLRGMRRGRFRDDYFAGGQVEYRMPVAWRIGVVGNLAVGRVAPSLGELTLDHLKYTVGGGLRVALDRRERINARADFGVSGDDTAVYIKLQEAF